MTELALFAYEGHQVRTMTVDGEPWVVAVDVCAALEIGNARQAVAYLDDDEVRQLPVTTNDGSGRVLPTNIVNEPGLYSLILRSRKPEAKAFKRWITHDVLPQIRKTGRYEAAGGTVELSLDAYEQLIDGGKQLIGRLRAQQRELECSTARVAELEPSAQAWDTLASADGDFSVREAAHALNRDHGIDTGQRRLFALLRTWRVIDRNNVPYVAHSAHVRLRPRSYLMDGEWMPAEPQVRITMAGLRYIHRRMTTPDTPRLALAANNGTARRNA